MKQLLLALALLACMPAQGAVIGFDDLPGIESDAIANGYHGFDWHKVGALRADAYPDSGYAAGTVSFANTAYNRDGATAAVSKEGGFTFAGAWFTSAWIEQEIAFEGWRDGRLVYASAQSYALGTDAPRWIGLGWTNIDTLVIYNSSGTPWAMDDFTVPEPASMALFGTALAGIWAARRKPPKASRL